jgi:hypothetical protein
LKTLTRNPAKEAQSPSDLPLIASTPLFLPTERQRRVAEAAYYRYLMRGDAPGDPLQDWLQAEAEIDSSAPQA